MRSHCDFELLSGLQRSVGLARYSTDSYGDGNGIADTPCGSSTFTRSIAAYLGHDLTGWTGGSPSNEVSAVTSADRDFVRLVERFGHRQK